MHIEQNSITTAPSKTPEMSGSTGVLNLPPSQPPDGPPSIRKNAPNQGNGRGSPDSMVAAAINLNTVPMDSEAGVSSKPISS